MLQLNCSGVFFSSGTSLHSSVQHSRHGLEGRNGFGGCCYRSSATYVAAITGHVKGGKGDDMSARWYAP